MYKTTTIVILAALSGLQFDLIDATKGKHHRNAVIAEDVYFFQNVQTDLYMESPHYRGALGSSMGKYSKNDSPHQIFRMHGAPQGNTIQPLNADSDEIIGYDDDFTFNGDLLVTLGHNDPNLNNTWNFPYCTVSTFFIENNGNKFVISDNGDPNQPLQLVPRTGAAKECWHFTSAASVLSSL